MVEYMIQELPPGVALVITADHGQVDVGDRVFPPHPEVLGRVAHQSGEARFRWLHAAPGEAARPAARRDRAPQRRRLGRVPRSRCSTSAGSARRSCPARCRGSVTSRSCPFEPIAFEDPADTGPFRLKGRHGSMTAAEVMVPLLVARG